MTAICNVQTPQPRKFETASSILSGAMRRILNLAVHNYHAYKTHRTNRRAFVQMLNLEEGVLSDIGVTRDDVLWASNLPIEVNAALELEAIRTANKQSTK